MKIDLACGQRKMEGYVGVDVVAAPDVDVVHDLAEVPWPFDDDVATHVFSSHFVEHVPDLVSFMNETYRICAPDAEVVIVHPYLKSTRAFMDPTHVRFIPSETWYYFNHEWRVGQQIDHYPITADFEVVSVYADWLGDWAKKSDEAQQFAMNHYWDVVGDLTVLLKAKK